LAVLRLEGKLPALDVGHVDWPFSSGGEHGDDTAKGCSLLKEWQEVEDESIARIESQR
jgi:hypothetical protein